MPSTNAKRIQDKTPEADAAQRTQGADTGSHPKPDNRVWAAANKRDAGGRNKLGRQKLPFGPLGGSGRKTNRARSS